MKKGVIKKKMGEGKTFGFIAIDGEPGDMFFHEKQLVGVTFAELNEGDAVTFEVEEGQNGKLNAVNVQRA